MNKHIVITQEQAEQIKGRYGKYSAIEPIPTPDGNYIIPELCLTDADLAEAKAKIEAANGQVQDIIDLPEVGQPVEGGRLYRYASETSGLVKAVQAHERTIYPPEQTPALFSFFRENSDELEWIPNEWVKLGWKRVYNGIQYEVMQAHMTLEGWQPDKTPALWQLIEEQPEISEWKQPAGGNDAYNTGDRVLFEGKTYESLIDANVWSPSAYPAGWKQI